MKNDRVTKKPQIMAAALKLFVEKGIIGTTIRDIAQEAGVAEGAMYRHFKSKDELARRLFYDNLRRFIKELKKRLDHDKDTYQKIRTSVKTFLTFFEEEPLLCTYLFIAEHTELNKFSSRATRPKDILIKIIEEGKKVGNLREIESNLATAMLMGMVHRVTIFKRNGFLRIELPELIEEVTDSFWRIVAKRPSRKQENYGKG